MAQVLLKERYPGDSGCAGIEDLLHVFAADTAKAENRQGNSRADLPESAATHRLPILKFGRGGKDGTRHDVVCSRGGRTAGFAQRMSGHA